MPVFSKPEDADDELTRLMLKAVPENERGHKTLSHLAKLIGVTNWAMRKWILNQKIPASRVAQIVQVAEGRVTHHDFEAFVYKT